MNICPITYEPCGNDRYSKKGLKLLSANLVELKNLPLTQEEQLKEASIRAVKMSIQGIQPKLSARLSPVESSFIIVDTGGTYILKPQNNYYPQLPENEDLTMRLAEIIGLDVPFHGMIYSKDGKLTYFIKRFDRYGKNKKYSLEDFAQLSGNSRDTKYDYSMERLKDILFKFCTFPAIESLKLFKLTLFNFLVGNEDQHLKNFSLITKNNKVELSPVYDLLNTSIALPKVQEEIALPLKGKKKNLTSTILIDYYGKDRLNINEKVIQQICEEIKQSFPEWKELISRSFLTGDLKERYTGLLFKRFEVLFG